MSKHTPGPWMPPAAGDVSIRDASRLLVAYLPMAFNDDECAEIEANARLIAAAPCLLAALKDVLAAHGEQLHDAFAAACAAIAKAEDQSSEEIQP